MKSLTLLVLILLGSLPAIFADCGDGTCSADENPSNCPEDCGLCGNGVCDYDQFEDRHYCPVDCQFFLETFAFGNDYVKWIPSSAPSTIDDDGNGDSWLTVTFPARSGTELSGYFNIYNSDWADIVTTEFRGGFFFYETRINQQAVFQAEFPDFIIYSASLNAYLYYYFSSDDYTTLSDRAWHSVSVDLEVEEWGYIQGSTNWAAGSVSTDANWNSFIGHVSAIYIKGQFSNNGNFITNLDNMQLAPEGVTGICSPSVNCANVQCGSNGCGVECGTCAPGQTCSSTGFCFTTSGPVTTGTTRTSTGTTGIVSTGTTGIVSTGTTGIVSTGTTGIVSTGTTGIVSTGTTRTSTGSTGVFSTGTTGFFSTGTTGFFSTGTTGTSVRPSTGTTGFFSTGTTGTTRTSTGSTGVFSTGTTGTTRTSTGSTGVFSTGSTGTTGCIRQCTNGRNCGSDGCGGSCGTCSGLDQCLNGICTCVASCSGKQCGSNGCGGTCGTCPTGQSCTTASQCVIFCGDGLCYSPTENATSCPKDCQVCGDGICNGLETRTSCPVDCSNICGNAACEAGENPTNCPSDCVGCGDKKCQASIGESVFNCPEDCGTCGDHVCDFNTEDSRLCPEDCGYCGNGICDADKGENTVSCEVDCGVDVCGDGRCTAGESAQTCPEDCGAPTNPSSVSIVLNFAGLIPALDCCSCCAKK